MGAEASDVLDTPEAGRTAVRGSVVRAGAYVVGVLLTLISAPLLIRHLGISEFGRYTAVVSVVTVVAGVTEGGLNTIALRELVTLAPEMRDRLMANLLGVRLVLALAGVLVAALFSAVAGYGSALVVGTALAGVGMVLQVTQSLFSTSLQAELRFGWASVADMVRQVVNVALIVALVVAGAGVVAFLAVPVPASLAALVVTIVLVRGRLPMRPRLERSIAGPLLKDTLPYTASVAVNVVYFRVAILLMSIIATAEQTGYFATSFRVVEILVAVPGLALGAAFPILARARRDDAERFGYATRRVFELGVISGTWIALGVVLGAPLIIRILAGPEGDPAVSVLRIQGLAIAATWIANAASFPLLSLRSHRALLVTNLLALATTAVLTLVLVPGLEAEGAAIATVVAEATLAATTTWLLVRAAPEVGLRPGIVLIAFASAAVAAAPALLLGLPSIPAAVLGSIVFFALLLLSGRFPPEVAELLATRRAKGAA